MDKSTRKINLKLKTTIAAGFSLLFLGLGSGQAITMEVHRVSDHALAGLVDFGSMSASTIYAQGQHYVIVRYQPGEEDTDTLKIFSDNRNWQGTSNERGGLVQSPTPTERVPVYWTAFGDLQPGVALNAQNENTWKSLKDQNDSGFSSYNPSDISLPLFPTGTTFIYFGAKTDLTTPAAFYTANIKVKNGSIGANITVFGNGFGAFDKVFRSGQAFEFVYNSDATSNINLKILDRKGRSVATVFSGEQGAGNHTVSWDGRDEDNQALASGWYVALLKIGKDIFKTKIVIVR